MSSRSIKHIYLSPHFDDVAYSCAGNIDRQVKKGEKVLVITVFGALPPDGCLSPLSRSLHTEWGLGPDAPVQRAEEDRRAMASLGADFEHWDFLDAIYRRNVNVHYLYPTFDALYAKPHPSDGVLVDRISSKLLRLIRQSRSEITIYAPLGVGGHVDHTVLRKAVWNIFHSGFEVFFYEDLPYVASSLEFLYDTLPQKKRIWWQPEIVRISVGNKLRAVACYSSQGMDRKHNQQKIDHYASDIGDKEKGAERFWRPIERRSPCVNQWTELLACPSCGKSLQQSHTSWSCIHCNRDYPIHHGIVDFRGCHTTRISQEFLAQDLERARFLSEINSGAISEQMFHYHVQNNNESPMVCARSLQSNFRTKKRTLDLLSTWFNSGQEIRPFFLTGVGLDIGCGSEMALLTLAAVSPFVVCMGFCLSDLISIRNLLEKHDLSEFALIVAGSADTLPFRDEFFAHVIANDVYGHEPNRIAFLQEAHRVIQPGGLFLFSSESRFNLIGQNLSSKGPGYFPRSFPSQLFRLLRNQRDEVFLPTFWKLRRDIREALPSQTPFIIEKPVRLKKKVPPKSWKSRFAHRIPGLVDLINEVYGHMAWFNVLVSKQR